ncbi:MAG: hypothetical protein WBW84_04560 [Acidobacteriaceae bacterium]
MAQEDPIAKIEKLLEESQKLRLNAILSRIGAVHALCSIAETEVRWEPPEVAEPSVQKVQKSIEGLYRHIDNPQHVPAELREEFRRKVAEIETRLLKISQLLRNLDQLRAWHHTV